MNELRQGDIVKGLFFPHMKTDNLLVLATLDQSNLPSLVLKEKKYGQQMMQALIGIIPDFCIVISQCCDLQVREGQEIPSATAIVVAPLFATPSDIAKDSTKLEKLRLNGKDYAHLFSIAKVSPLSDDHSVVDFSRVVSVPISEYRRALHGKVLQMTDAARVRFKTKLGAHFARPTNEELSAGLYPTDLE